MSILRDNPIIKVLLYWLAGIGLASMASNWQLICMSCALMLLALIVFYRKKIIYRNLYSSLLLGICIISASAINSQSLQQSIPASPKEKQDLLFYLESAPIEKANSFECTFRIEESTSNSLKNLRFISWIPKTDSLHLPMLGELYFNTLSIKRIKNKGNPYEFDYADFMASKEIYFQTYLRGSQLEKVGEKELSIMQRSSSLRDKMLAKYKSILSPKNFQVISALSLGYKDELEEETKTNFKTAGLMHILAVSGLHVGIIFAFLLFITSPLKKIKYGVIISTCLAIVGIWIYAILCGLSPSVQRAAMMLSFIGLGIILNRPQAIYSSIGASALFLLVINPNLLANIGFQLSYAAVISIVFFKAKFDGYFNPKNRLLNKLWGLISVSIAAQLGTAPLCLLYFNQFPNYFILSNLIAIPMACVLLIGSLSYLIVPTGALTSKLYAYLLNQVGDFFNATLHWFSTLPHASTNQIHLSIAQFCYLLCSIVLLAAYLHYKNKKLLITSLSCMAIILGLNILDKKEKAEQSFMLSYNNSSVYHFIKGSTNYIVYSGEKPSAYLFKNSVNELRLSEPIYINLKQQKQYADEHLIIDNQLYLWEGKVQELKFEH